MKRNMFSLVNAAKKKMTLVNIMMSIKNIFVRLVMKIS